MAFSRLFLFLDHLRVYHVTKNDPFPIEIPRSKATEPSLLELAACSDSISPLLSQDIGTVDVCNALCLHYGLAMVFGVEEEDSSPGSWTRDSGCDWNRDERWELLCSYRNVT